jgi:phage gpG-like protein
MDDSEFRRRLIAGLQRGLAQQGGLLVGSIKERISRSQPVYIVPATNKRTGLPNRTQGKVIGLDPSRPGEPPKQASTRLKMSIAFEVVTDTSAISLFVGSNLEYARALEKGTSKMAARPYLDVTLQERMPILVKGVARELGRELRA